MRPLKIKSSAYPVSSSNFQGLQEMTDTEIEQYYSAIITHDFAANTNGTHEAELNVTTNNSGAGTAIGTAVDTVRDDAVGTHPTDGATSIVNTYYMKQVTGAGAESITNRPVGYETSGNVGINEFTDTELDDDIIDKIVEDMVGQGDYVCGQYVLAASAPAGGTWTARYTLTDTQVDSTSASLKVWQKTAPTSSAVDNYKPLKVDGTSIKEMSEAEMEQILPNFRNRIVENFGSTQRTGTYKLQATTPTETGTWTQQGDVGGWTDTRKTVGAQNYTGGYAGTYTGTYSGVYTGVYTGVYGGVYSGDYTGAYTGNYTGTYTGGYTGAKTYSGAYAGAYGGAYTGNYVGTSAYTGNYSGVYGGNYSGAYSGAYTATFSGYHGTTYAGSYTGTYAGNYTGTYTGYYTGAKTYSGVYAGTYTGSYTGNFVGTSAYSGDYTGTYTGYYSGVYGGAYGGAFTGNYTGSYTGGYAGNYTGTYSGVYSGDTIQSGSETVSTKKLWLRTA